MLPLSRTLEPVYSKPLGGVQLCAKRSLCCTGKSNCSSDKPRRVHTKLNVFHSAVFYLVSEIIALAILEVAST